MVHLVDQGSKLDAPLDVIWKYLGDPEAHGGAHRTSRNHKMTPITERSFTLSMEQNVGGQWVKLSNRVTVYPPLGMTVEVLEGPMAGSTMMNVYTPDGPKTEISVFADFQSSQLPPKELEAAARASLEAAFNEDNEALRHYTPKK